MLSINTNLSSLIAQGSMKSSTNKLNQAIERMTTGFKINHAKDNAANYSIATNMATKIGAYMVAEDNVMSGLDLVSTANEVISLMEDRASRLSALSIQARNGTYGAQSLEALNAEAGALVSEIMRLYNSTQFNNVNLFNRTSFTLDENLPQAGSNGFIEEPISTFAMRATTTSPPTAKAEYGGFIEDPKTYTDQQVADMKTITQAISESSLVSGGEYSISTKDELVALADYVNAGNDTTGMTFVLGADIDLSSIANWTPIGNSTNTFNATFDGNGHSVKGLNIVKNAWNMGLFGVASNLASIKNIKLEDVYIKDTTGGVGGLVGNGGGCAITNSVVLGDITGGQYTGGIVGRTAIIDSCIFEGNIVAMSRYIGGLVGYNEYTISNSYSNLTIKGLMEVGGIVGIQIASIENCYSKGDVVATQNSAGGLCGITHGDVNNCFSESSVSGTYGIGGLLGSAKAKITNSYATGDVNGTGTQVGGFIGSTFGHSLGLIKNCYATGDVTSNNSTTKVGGFIGDSITKMENCYATGNVSGGSSVGGFAGNVTNTITNCYSTGPVTGVNNVGGLVGYTSSTLTSCYSIGDVVGEKFVGGLVGQAYKVSGASNYTQCHAYGKSSGVEGAGGLIGGAVLTTNGTSFGTINTVDCQALSQSSDAIGGVYQYDSATSTYTLLSSYDMNTMLSGIKEYVILPTTTTLHIGINGNESSSLSFDTNFIFDFTSMDSDVSSDEFYNSVKSFVGFLHEKTTILGAVSNRLESVLEEITIKRDNLVSSRSTILDADIAEVSSHYIQQQILQQASATLLATANQSPSIALQLI